jgi:tRNA dimethylallyltransferase
MMSSGLLEEVQSLFSKRHLNALDSVGYKELFEYLENKSSIADAIEEIKKNTRHFAKRQMTWFRRVENIHWFHPDDKDKILSFVRSKLTTA